MYMRYRHHGQFVSTCPKNEVLRIPYADTYYRMVVHTYSELWFVCLILNGNRSDTSIPLVTTITDLRNVASLLLFGGLVGLLYVSARKPISSSANARAPIVGVRS